MSDPYDELEGAETPVSWTAKRYSESHYCEGTGARRFCPRDECEECGGGQ